MRDLIQTIAREARCSVQDATYALQIIDAAGLLAKYPHLEVDGDWLIEAVNEHTCGAGPGSGAGHEPGCGTIPVGRLLTPEVEAEVAARALRDAADALDGGIGTSTARFGMDPHDYDSRADYGYAMAEADLRACADRIEREGGAS